MPTSDKLFDAHCHLKPDDQKAPAKPAQPVAGRILCSVDPSDWPRIKHAAESWPGTIPAYGLHPWRVAPNLPANWQDELSQLLTADPTSWLGESGLDDKHGGVDQTLAFRAQLRTASRTNRPANLHCVGGAATWDRFVDCLDEEFLTGGCGRFIVHGFGGPYQYVKPLLERGAYFTVGPLNSLNSRKIRERARLFPLDRILLESDAFLTPGADAPEVLESALDWLSELFEEPQESLNEQVTHNVRKVLNHAEKGAEKG